jgi:hypothetical protein
MCENQYAAQLMAFSADLTKLDAKLVDLDIQRDEVRKQRDQIKKVVHDLSVLCGIATETDLSLLGFTDACRAVLRKNWQKEFSATELRDALSQNGYDLTAYSNPLSSIYTILRRLEESTPSQVRKVQNGLKVTFQWLPRRFTRRSRRPVGDLKPVTESM